MSQQKNNLVIETEEGTAASSSTSQSPATNKTPTSTKFLLPPEKFEEFLLSSPLGRDVRKLLPQQYHPRNLNVESTASKNHINVVILMSGALNPPHRSHVRALQVAARTLQRQFEQNEISSSTFEKSRGGGSRLLREDDEDDEEEKGNEEDEKKKKKKPKRVMAVSLVPSSDFYIAHKLKEEGLKVEVRCELCDLACQEEAKNHLEKVVSILENDQQEEEQEQEQSTEQEQEKPSAFSSATTASASSSSPSPSSSSPSTAAVVPPPPQWFPVIVRDYNEANGTYCCQLLRKELEKSNPPGYDFVVVPLYGSDFAWKCQYFDDMVCIERHDEEKTGEFVRKVVEGKIEGLNAGEDFFFIPNSKEEEGDQPVSSSAVRKALNEGNKETLDKMLHESVAKKMLNIHKAASSPLRDEFFLLQKKK